MKLLKVLGIIFSVSIFLLVPFSPVFADQLILQTDGKVSLMTDNGQLKYFLFSHEKFTNPQVLGASSGVVITVSLSSFIPTDTPVPTSRPTPTPTPTSNTSSSISNPTPTPTKALSSLIAIALPTPTSIPSVTSKPVTSITATQTPIPSPPPISKLIANITTPSTTTTQAVNQVTQETSDGNSLVITSTSDNSQLLITQGTTFATTFLPIQLNSQTKKLHVVISGHSYPVVSPKEAIQTIQSVGTYIIPSSIQIDLTSTSNQPIYRITGNQHVQILNTFIIDFPLTLEITANSPTQVQVKNPFLVTFLEFFHIGRRVIG